MDLVSLVIVVIVLGLVYYLISALLPLPQPFKNVVLAIFILIIIIVLLQYAGIVNLRR